MSNEQLVTLIKAGENTSENMKVLYLQVKSFIHVMAMRYQGMADLEDLEQEGYLALYPAIDGYDPEKGVLVPDLCRVSHQSGNAELCLEE